MRTLKRSKAIAALAAGLVVTGTGIAAADNLASDGDDLAALADTNWAIGDVCAGATGNKNVPIYVTRSGSGTNVYKNSSTVWVSGSAGSAGLTIESGTKSISLPVNWATVANGTKSTTTAINVAYTAPTALGGFTKTVNFSGSGLNGSNEALTRTDTMTVSGTVIGCDSTPPSITPNVTGTEGDNDWYTSNVQLSWTVSDSESAMSSRSGCDTVNITSDQAATTYTCSATSLGGTDSQSVSIKRDATAPVVTPDDVLDSNWRNTNLSQAFTASDARSGLANNADANFTLTAADESANASTPTTDSKTVSDAAGNTTIRTLSAKIDKSAPEVAYTSASGTAGLAGWYTSAVTATFTGTDVLSGPASVTKTEASAGEGAAVEVQSPAFTDAAGNTAAAGAVSQSFKIDVSDPAVRLVGGPVNGAEYPFGSVPAAPTCDAGDTVSGLAGCTLSGYSTAVGTHTVIATARDNAGRTATDAVTYTVNPWKVSTFFQPVDMSATNTAKAGSTVPVKFEITSGSTELTSLSAVTSVKHLAVSCSTLTTGGVDEIEQFSTSTAGLKYDSTNGGQYIYTWKTPTAGCYKLTVTAADGAFQTAFFNLRK